MINNKKILGALLMSLAGLLFALMGLSVKIAAAHYTAPELIFYRALFGLVFLFLVSRLQKTSLQTRHWRLHVYRSGVGYLAILLYFFAMTRLPLATAVTLNYTSPLFLGAISLFYLKEKMNFFSGLALILGFVAVLFILQPSLQDDAMFAALAGLASGFFAAQAYLHVRELGRLGEPETRVVFYFCLLCCLGGLVWFAFSPRALLPSLELLPPLLSLGLCATLAQLAMTRAYAVGDKLVVATFSYSTILFAALLSYVFWDEVLTWDMILAMMLMIFAGLLAVRAKQA